MPSRAAASLLVFALPLSVAAQTFVVDAANGPGANFTTIAAATAAVPDGSILLVRAGSYNQFEITGKSLKVLCDPGVTVLQTFFGGTPIRIQNLTAQQGVVLRNFRFASGNNSPVNVGLQIVNCQGPVLIDDVRQVSSFGLVHVNASAAVQVRRHRFDPSPGTAQAIRYVVTSSNVVLTECDVGPGPGGTNGAAPALQQNGGTVQLVDTTVRGSFNLFSTSVAFEMNGGDARLLGTTSVSGFGPIGTLPGSLAVEGTGTLRAEPTVSFVGAPPVVAPGITRTTKVMPRVRAQFASGVATVELAGSAGHLGAIALALPGTRVPAGFEDALWLDLGTFAGVGTTVLGGAPFSVSLPLSSGMLPGARIAFQGLTFDAVAGFQLSNPAFVILP